MSNLIPDCTSENGPGRAHTAPTLRALLLGIVIVSSAAGFSSAQLPAAGPEVQLDDDSAAEPTRPRLASLPDGRFAAVWRSTTEATGADVVAAAFSEAGAPSTPPFRVNTYTTGNQTSADVASLSNGGLVVVWDGVGPEGFGDIFARLHDPNGDPVAGEFVVSSSGGATQPAVAAGSAEGFVVGWRTSYYVLAQRFDDAGLPLSGEIVVNTYTTAGLSVPAIARDRGGNFLIAWQDARNGEPFGVRGRRFSSSGLPTGPVTQINTYTTGGAGLPAITADGTDGFVVAWRTRPNLSQSGVRAQRLSSVGSKVGVELQVASSNGTDTLLDPDVAATADGRFLVQWRIANSDRFEDGDAIEAALYDDTGAPLGQPFVISSDPSSGQTRGRIEALHNGDFIAAWEDDGVNFDGVVARRIHGEVSGLQQPSTLVGAIASDPDAPSFVADDFFLMEPNVLNQLKFCGGYSPGNTPFSDDFEVRIFSDNGGAPGTQVASYTGLSVSRQATGRTGALDEYCYEVTLPAFTSPLAHVGHRWIEISNDSSGSGQTWAWLGGELDPVAGFEDAAASANGVSWTAGAADRALEIPYRTFATAGVTFYWGESLWNHQVTNVERFDTTPANVALADEVANPPSSGSLGTPSLSWPSSSTGLSRSFTLAASATNWIYNGNLATMQPTPYDLALQSSNRDFEITIDAGPPLHAFAMTIAGAPTATSMLTVHGIADAIIETLPLGRISFARPLTFLGVITDEPITRIELDDAGGASYGVLHFRFAERAAEAIFADGFESGDTMSWSSTNP